MSGSADQHLADTATETVEREIGNTLEEHDERLLGAIGTLPCSGSRKASTEMSTAASGILEERLEAMPWATLCIDCKRKEERARRGQVGRDPGGVVDERRRPGARRPALGLRRILASGSALPWSRRRQSRPTS